MTRPRIGWLPCVGHGSARWWLPLSRSAADVLAATLVAGTADPRRLAALADRLRVDPPLLIFAALATSGDEPAAPRSLSIEQLAERLGKQLVSLLAGGESALGGVPAELALPGGEATPVGEATPASERKRGRKKSTGGSPGSLSTVNEQGWQQLWERFLRLPHSQWLAAAGDWLELTGPPVPVAWRDTWPTIADDSHPSTVWQPAEVCFAAGQLDLALLARTVRRDQSLQHTFLDSLQQAKRAALKQFAYGLSHEINNPLANISTRAQTLLRDETDAGRSKSLQRIIDQTMRAHEMIADLMFYAHPPQPQANSVDLQEILRAVVSQSLEAVQGRCIELVISPQSHRVTLVADRGMLLEAIRALVRNAIEAIGCDGRVQLACERQPLPQSALAPPIRAESAAVVTVCDSGPGLSETARTHAFDPYYSGREAGRGLGVGLCRVERIAQLHRGGVSLHSGPAGCTARLWIPLVR